VSEPLVTATPQGLYCAAGDFYIDPIEPVARAVITHAHGDHARPGSQAYLATAASLPILRHRLGAAASLAALEYGEAVQLGGARVSLHPAGHVLGSAQVRIEADTGGGREAWVVSGDYKRGADPTCAPFEVVPCDVFVTEATFAAPIYRWEPGEAVAGDVLAWWRDCAAEGSTALLFCYAFGKAQRLLAELGRLEAGGAALPNGPIYLHGAMVELVALYRAAGVAMPETAHLGDDVPRASYPGRLVLAPPSAYRSPWMRRFKAFETAFASGWMRVRGAQRQRGHDRGFVLSDHADWPELTRTAAETGARRILVMHGRADLLVRWLRERGQDAAELATAFTRGSEE
jgi:putative mRNA 3-end processing factor